MGTYYTKCGREFKKTTKASVTGYKIDEADYECMNCIFRIEITKGYPPEFDRWECRSGSKPPNQANEWSGRLDDKTTLYIKSLNIDFINRVIEYCESNSGNGIASCSFSQDIEDCRRLISVSFEQNKKGIAAKKALVDELFNKKDEEEVIIGKQSEKYIDDKNRLIFVRCGIGGESYKPMYQVKGKWGSAGAHGHKAFQWRETQEEAQKDLDEYAVSKGWKIYDQVTDKKDVNNDLAHNLVKHEDNQSFNYQTLDLDTANFLQEKEAKITQIRMMSAFAIGKELKEAQEKLSNHYQGTFRLWIESIGMSHQTVYNYINGYDYVVKNFDNPIDAEQFKPSLLFAISKPSAPIELQEKVLAGDITTHKEYKELEKQLKIKEQEALLISKRVSEAEKSLVDEKNEHESNKELYKNEINTAQEKIEKLQLQLKESSSKVNVNEISNLREELAEAQRQVEILTDELMTPVAVEPTVVEKVIEVERAIDKDFDFISDIFGKLTSVHNGQFRNWVKVIASNNSFDSCKDIKNRILTFHTTIETIVEYLDEEIQNK